MMEGARKHDQLQVGPCKVCGHGAASHAERSGLCAVDGCRCEGFQGPVRLRAALEEAGA